MDTVLGRIGKYTNNSDLMVALGILGILVVMIVPIAPWILDLFIALTLALSVVILLISVYSKKPLDFSTFPSVLLVMTLFRLSLNVASTRNILLRGGSSGTSAAGQIIRSFGEFVVEGNYIVGIIVFIILVIINFMVITKGAGRVAEVAARFTLDAMPGKQMAIDADLNAGLIDEADAKERRRLIAEEADFYGSMDGASKFVRGDAIAGILITVLNIIAGIIVGVFQSDMDFSQAAETFTLLTVGDGLVSQIPALIISTAAGIIATRNTNDSALGMQVAKQLRLHPKSLYMGGGVLFVFAIIPGLPKVPFIIVGVGLCLVANKLEKINHLEETAPPVVEEEIDETDPDHLEDLLNVEIVELEVGYGLVNLVDSEQNGDLLERITHIRKQFALDWGVIIPSVKIRDNLELKPGGYIIKIKGIEIAEGELVSDHFLAMDPGTVIENIEGVETKEPVFGLPAVWITEDQKENAQYNGYTVVDLATVVATHLTEILKTNLHEIFGKEDLSNLMDKMKESNPKLVEELVPDILPLGVILKVLKNLLREGVSVRDMRTILECLSDVGTRVKDAVTLNEAVRQSLFRTITYSVKSENNDIPVFTLDRKVEELIAEGLIQTDEGVQLSLDPKVTQGVLGSINEKIEEATEKGERMIILCSPVVRSHFKRLTEKFIPNLIVISHSEITPEVSVRSLGTVRL
jgi:flagellar biosynthesis protein FlhA